MKSDSFTQTTARDGCITNLYRNMTRRAAALHNSISATVEVTNVQPDISTAWENTIISCTTTAISGIR